MKNRKLSLIILVLCSLYLVGWSESPRLGEGDTIRVTSKKYFLQPAIGKLIGVSEDSLKFSMGLQTINLPVESIQKLEVIMGKKRNTKKGMGIGAIGGGLFTGLLVAIDASNHQGEWFVPKPGTAFLAGFISGGLLGAGAGAIIGTGSYSPVWQEIPLIQLRTITVAPKIEHPSAAEVSSSARLEPATKSRGIKRKWCFSFIPGSTSSGPAKDIEKAMVYHNFDDISPGDWFSEPKVHPYSNKEGIPWSMFLQRRFHTRWGLAFLLSNAVIGSSNGYQKSSGAYLKIKSKVFTLAPLGYYRPLQKIKLGIGPALFRCISQQIDGDEVLQKYSKEQIGLLFDLRLTLPENTFLFVELNAQYRFIPRIRIGPFITGGDFEDVTVPDFEVNYSHMFFGLGIGLRK